MPELGQTKLEAINEILRSVNQGAVAALDPGGSSDASNAERVLDQITQDKLLDGFHGNVSRAVTYTATLSGSDYLITFGTDVLRVDCLGPGRYRGNISLRGGDAFIITEDTKNFGSAVTLIFDVYKEIAWADLTPDVKRAITKAAVEQYRMNYMFDERMQKYLMDRALEADARTDRVKNDRVGDPVNPGPFFAPRSEAQ